MSTATLIDSGTRRDMGRLANNYILVQAIQTALSTSEMNSRSVPRILGQVIDRDAWREFVLPNDRDDRIATWNTADFRQFIESPRPEGCQVSCDVVRQMIAGDEPLVRRFEQLIRGTPGGDNNPDGLGGWTGKGRKVDNRNIITDDNLNPAIIPLSPDRPRPARNYARESKQGTSVGYALRRLENNRPDLLEKVKAGDLSPHKAMVVAGFVEKQITIPADVTKASRRLLLHFEGARLITLVTELANHAGYDLVPKA